MTNYCFRSEFGNVELALFRDAVLQHLNLLPCALKGIIYKTDCLVAYFLSKSASNFHSSTAYISFVSMVLCLRSIYWALMAFRYEAGSLCWESVTVFHYTGIISSVPKRGFIHMGKGLYFLQVYDNICISINADQGHVWLHRSDSVANPPMAAQLSMKAALPLTKDIATASYRNSSIGSCATIGFPGHK